MIKAAAVGNHNDDIFGLGFLADSTNIRGLFAGAGGAKEKKADNQHSVKNQMHAITITKGLAFFQYKTNVGAFVFA